MVFALLRYSISIHELHTELDFSSLASLPVSVDFNPRAPYGARPPNQSRCACLALFQSSRSIRCSSFSFGVSSTHSGFQSTSSIRSSTPSRSASRQGMHISIHELHTELDGKVVFLSQLLTISIHELHTELDVNFRRQCLIDRNFNPRAPYGARQQN